jgi:hypothetical protein
MSLIKLKIATNPRIEGNICIKISESNPPRRPRNLKREKANAARALRNTEPIEVKIPMYTVFKYHLAKGLVSWLKSSM